MINVSGNKWIPSDGYKYISNGTVWTDSILLGNSDSIENWHDTNEEPPDPEEQEDATEQDYQTALHDLGVSM